MSESSACVGRMLALSVGVAAFGTGPALAASGDWKPDKVVEIIVNTGPGASPDRTARVMQRIFQQQRLVEVPVTVSNRVGGGGAIAYSYLNQRPGDGQFIAIASKLILASHIMGRGPHYAEFTPLAHLFGEYIVIGVKADSPIRSGKDLVETDEWKKDLETGYLSGEFLGGADLRKLMDRDYAQVKAFLTELELAK